MPTYRGLPACDCLAQWCAAFENLIERQPLLFQLAGDAPASAGFHKNGGSVDYEPLSEAELRIARNMGGAAWNRWWYDSDGDTNFHSHARLNGCPHNTIGQPQVEDLNEGRDGTGPLYDNAGAPDDGPRDGVHFPLRTWREGIEWAKEQGDDMPYTEKQLTDLMRGAVKAELAPMEAALREVRKSIRQQVTSVRKKLDGPIDSLDEVRADLDDILGRLEP